MISSLKTIDGSCGAYIGAIAGRQAIRQTWPPGLRRNGRQNYRDFTEMNRF
jgi:hypothetical protein